MSDVSQKVENAIEFYYVEYLQNMAAITVVNKLWYHPSVQRNIELYFAECDRDLMRDPYGPWFWCERIVQKLGDLTMELELPDCIRDFISSFVPLCSKHLADWLQDTDLFVFDLMHVNKHFAFRYMNDIHWSSDGSVNRLKTAEFMLQNTNLNDKQKFRIMSTYCMVNRLNEISPSEFRNRYFEDVPFYKHPLQYYWNCHLNRDYLEYGELLDLIDRAEDPYMSNFADWTHARPCRLQRTCGFYLKNCFLPNIHAASYFWEQLQGSEKVSLIVESSIEAWFSSEIFWGLMSTLEANQLDQVLDKALPYIVQNLSHDLPYEDRALELAARSTPQQFAHIIEIMLTPVARDERVLFFTKLWKSASAVQRSYVFNSNTKWVYTLLCNPYFGKYLDDMIFVFTHQIEYERIKNIIFSIDWNRDRLKLAKGKFASQFRQFIDRVLRPQDAVIVKENLKFAF